MIEEESDCVGSQVVRCVTNRVHRLWERRKNPACGLVDNPARLRILISSKLTRRADIITDPLGRTFSKTFNTRSFAGERGTRRGAARPPRNRVGVKGREVGKRRGLRPASRWSGSTSPWESVVHGVSRQRHWCRGSYCCREPVQESDNPYTPVRRRFPPS